MNDVAIIGASYLQLPLILKAREMGYTTHVFAWAAGDVGEAAADFFYPISIVEKEEILARCREIGILGVCSIASDLAAVTVNYVADRMGLTGNSLHSTEISTNKFRMREAFARRGDPIPRYALADAETDFAALAARMPMPLIVKPTDRSGSRGITRVERPDQLEQAVRTALDQSFEKKAMVEEFAEGQEYSVEYISFRGEHHFLAMTLKYTTGAPHFIETGHLEPAPVDEATLARVRAVVEHALDTLEIRNGASHSEIRIDDAGRIRLIEIGGRMGGDLIGSDLVRCSTGVDFVRAVLQVALGGEPDLTPVCAPRRTEVRFILTEEDLQAYEALQESHPERILRAEAVESEKIGCAADSSGRAGCYLVDLGPLA